MQMSLLAADALQIPGGKVHFRGWHRQVLRYVFLGTDLELQVLGAGAGCTPNRQRRRSGLGAQRDADYRQPVPGLLQHHDALAAIAGGRRGPAVRGAERQRQQRDATGHLARLGQTDGKRVAGQAQPQGCREGQAGLAHGS